MPYYTGDYYRGGDNYAAGGIIGSIGKFLGGAAKAVFKATPVGAVASAALPKVFGSPPQIAVPANMAPPVLQPVPGLKGFSQRLIPGGASGYMYGKRRRINVTNVKALRRAGRRVKGFLKLASSLGALPVNRGKGKKIFKKKRRAS